jgi:Neprosin/Neprosin activation peptide
MATEDPKGFPPFREFLKSIETAKHAAYAIRPDAKVANPDAFEEMKAYITKLGEGIDVEHSFVDGNGQIFDCVPVQQQPSLKNTPSASIAQPTDLPSFEAPGAGERPKIKPESLLGGQDKFGNLMRCPPGTIPVRRVTLEELSRFESLKDFFRKSPGVKDRLAPLSLPPATDPTVGHRYAAAYQQVDNLGGHSFLNVCKPTVSSPQMSLSQHWYTAGTGSNTQTAEGGWQIQPSKFNTPNPVLFIYWTADNYATTGSYNLEGGFFVQTNPGVILGGAIGTTEIELAWYLYQNNWWFYYGGTTVGDAVGYYPTSIYKNGALASFATQIEYGGETYGTTSWPPMGTGQFAATGLNKAAYQRNIFYYPKSGAAQLPTLTPYQPTPSCYTINVSP